MIPKIGRGNLWNINQTYHKNTT